MTSVVANARSHFSQPGMSNEPRYQYADLSRTHASPPTTSTLAHATSSSSNSSIPSTYTLALAAATPSTTMLSEATSFSQPSVMAPSASTSDPSSLYSAATIPSTRTFGSVLDGYSASPALPDISASCPPEGPSFTANDFDANLATAAFAPIFTSSANGTNGTSSFDASSAPLSFPVLPASLLDEAPEYEYVSISAPTGGRVHSWLHTNVGP